MEILERTFRKVSTVEFTAKAEFSNETDGGIKWFLKSLKTSSVTQDINFLPWFSYGIYALVVTGIDSLNGCLVTNAVK